MDAIKILKSYLPNNARNVSIGTDHKTGEYIARAVFDAPPQMGGQLIVIAYLSNIERPEFIMAAADAMKREYQDIMDGKTKPIEGKYVCD